MSVRVGIFTDNDFGKVNGVTTTPRAALEHAPSDIDARVYTCDSTGTEAPGYRALKAPGVGIPFYPGMRMHLPPWQRLLRQARADRLDVIHLTTPGPMGLAAVHVARRLRLPLIGSFHTDLAAYTTTLSGSRLLGAAMGAYLRWLYGRCREVLVPSNATRLSLMACGFDDAGLRIWRRGVSTERFHPGRRSDHLRSRWGVSDTRPAVLYAGRLSKEKGLSELVAVGRYLGLRDVRHRFVFVGDGPFRAELERLCPDAVFTGALAPEDVAVAMASSDLFVFPSRTDTAGNVVLEAQASGLPVLVTDEGGPREHMQDGETGFVCASTRQLTRHVLELCLGTDRRMRLGGAARAYALRQGWAPSLRPLYQAYRDAATEPVRGAALASRVAVL